MHAAPVPTAVAAERVGNVLIDGRIDEEGWSKATPITEFTQIDPEEGKPATQRTEIRFLFDDEALYVGARMYDKHGREGRRHAARAARRRHQLRLHRVRHRRAITTTSAARSSTVNPSGVEVRLLGVGTSYCDEAWDAIWEAATRSTRSAGPPSSGFPSRSSGSRASDVADLGTAGAALDPAHATSRSSGRSGEDRARRAVAVRAPRGASSSAACRAQLELLPYVVAQTAHIQATRRTTRSTTAAHRTSRVGGDVKYTADVQPHARRHDQPRTSARSRSIPRSSTCRAFETFFPEKRPFFVAGSGSSASATSTATSAATCRSLESFYSRRIGRSPQGATCAYGAGDYADVPDATTILGAAKITGRTQGGSPSVLLERAHASRGSARLDRTAVRGSPGGGAAQQLLRRPRDARTSSAATSSRRHRHVRHPRPRRPAAREKLPSHAEGLGLDWSTTGAAALQFHGQVAASNVAGSLGGDRPDPAASARYFQRPDRENGDNGLSATAIDSGGDESRRVRGVLPRREGRGQLALGGDGQSAQPRASR